MIKGFSAGCYFLLFLALSLFLGFSLPHFFFPVYCWAFPLDVGILNVKSYLRMIENSGVGLELSYG